MNIAVILLMNFIIVLLSNVVIILFMNFIIVIFVMNVAVLLPVASTPSQSLLKVTWAARQNGLDVNKQSVLNSTVLATSSHLVSASSSSK